MEKWVMQMNNEPVAWIRSGDDQLSLVKGEDDGYMVWNPLYTHPAKTLTDDEILELTKDSTIFEYREFDDDMVRFARAILRKAQEK